MDQVLDMFRSLGYELDSLAMDLDVSPKKLTKEPTAEQYSSDVMVMGIVIMMMFLMMLIVIFCGVMMNKKRKAFLDEDMKADQQRTMFDYIDFRKEANLV